MWCSICRQDVPGSIVPGGGQYCCPRCGETMPSSHGQASERPDNLPRKDAKGNIDEPPPASDYDEWEMEERLRHLDRIYARSVSSGPLYSPSGNQFRIDAAHSPLPRERARDAAPSGPSPGRLVRFGRGVFALGLAITVCGGCLAGWGYFGARPDLLPMGIPIAVAGQILLLFGLVLQHDSSPGESPSASQTPRSLSPYSKGDTDYRFDEGPGSSPQLTDLAARLEELSRRLDERDEG